MVRGLLLPGLLAASVGGWAAIAVEDLPEYVVAGRPVTLTFTVRQHGLTRLSGLSASVDARSGDAVAAATARAGAAAGQYVAVLTLPRPGDWTITIHSGFLKNRVTLLPLRAIGPGTAEPPPLPQSERGRQLFVAKGCGGCHVHPDVAGSGEVAVGPALAGRRLPADYVAQVLADPAIAARGGAGRMPNLDLKAPEISALVAFVTAERQALR